jgi:dephospho-CoA kinase
MQAMMIAMNPWQAAPDKRTVAAHPTGENRVFFGAESEKTGVPDKKARVVGGLTSSIACGKTLVLNAFRALGVPTLDVDKVVESLWETDAELKEKTRQEFGESVFTPEGKVDRKKLGRIVFNDPERRRLLESWIHPKVRVEMNRFIEQNALARLVIVEVPLLFESRMENLFDKILVVKATVEQQLQRLMSRNNMSREEAMARIQSQLSIDEKVRRAEALNGVIFDNTGTREQTEEQVRTFARPFLQP